MNVYNTNVDFKEIIMSITNENEATNVKHHRRTLQRLKIISIAQMYCYKAIKIQRFFFRNHLYLTHIERTIH